MRTPLVREGRSTMPENEKFPDWNPYDTFHSTSCGLLEQPLLLVTVDKSNEHRFFVRMPERNTPLGEFDIGERIILKRNLTFKCDRAGI